MNELEKENEQLKIKLEYFKKLSKRNHDLAQLGEMTLQRILFVKTDLAHRIAQQGLDEMKRFGRE